jgi:hypothetical protein
VGKPLGSADLNDPYGCDADGHATYWITKDKRRIKISDMTDAHLINTIRMLRRAAPAAYEARLAMICEALAMFKPKSMAAYYAEQELDRVLEEEDIADVFDGKWLHLKLEAERRGLPER